MDSILFLFECGNPSYKKAMKVALQVLCKYQYIVMAPSVVIAGQAPPKGQREVNNPAFRGVAKLAKLSMTQGPISHMFPNVSAA